MTGGNGAQPSIIKIPLDGSSMACAALMPTLGPTPAIPMAPHRHEPPLEPLDLSSINAEA